MGIRAMEASLNSRAHSFGASAAPLSASCDPATARVAGRGRTDVEGGPESARREEWSSSTGPPSGPTHATYRREPGKRVHRRYRWAPGHRRCRWKRGPSDVGGDKRMPSMSRRRSRSTGHRRGPRFVSFVSRRSFAMAERKPAKTGTQQSAKRTTGKASKGFTDEERAAMRERAQELKAAARRGPRADKADGESAVLAKIAEMPEPDRAMGKRLHAVIKASAPALSPRTWYGMPAYAKDGKVLCFFQSAQKFKTRYATLGFTDEANLDEGALWPVAFALKELTAAEEARIGALVKKAVSED